MALPSAVPPTITFVPRPVPIGYVPVENIDDLLKTIALGPVRMKKVDGKDDRYELIGPNRSIQVRLLDGYAFIGTDTDLLDGELPDPLKQTKTLAGRYDIAVAINLKSVPEGMKTVFLDFLRASAEAELQQRDDEPVGQYRLRRANGLSTLELVDLLLTQGENLTLGWNASAKDKTALVELSINATKDSKFAKYLKEIGSKRSAFASLLDRKIPLTASLSWMMDAREKKVLKELLQVAELGLSKGLNSGNAENPDAAKDERAARVFKPLLATAEGGHVDVFVQFVRQPGGKFVFNTSFFEGGQTPESLPFYRKWMLKSSRILRREYGLSPVKSAKVESRKHLTPDQYRQLVENHGLHVVKQEIDLVQVPIEGWLDISDFEDFIVGVMPGVPLEKASAALKEGVTQTYQEMGIDYVGRNWLDVIAVRN